MEYKIKRIKKANRFQPFEFTLTVGRIEEARFLYHIFNHAGIMGLISSDPRYSMEEYSKEIAHCDPAYIGVRNEILAQGFKL